MKLALTVYYEDGSSGTIEIERPAGAHPDSIASIAEGLLVAENSGKKVSRIGRSKVNPFSSPGAKLVIQDDLITRDQALKLLRLAQPMPEKFKRLFH